MQMFKRWVAMILCLVTFAGIFSGCAGVSENDEYITKGQFFALFIYEKDLYSDVYTAEQIAENETYELEAEVMWEWALIDEEQKGDLELGVTRELVVQTCVRFMAFREEAVAEGTVQSIKDIGKCHDRQAITDAVTMGLIELDNGYIDANEKLSYDDCYAIMDKMAQLERTVAMDAGELEVEYQDDVQILEDGEVLSIEYVYDEEDSSADALAADGSSNQVSNLIAGNDSMQITSLSSSTASSIKIQISYVVYDLNPTRYRVGSTLLYDPNTMEPSTLPTNLTDFRPFAGKITKVDKGIPNITLTLTPLELEKVVKDTDGINKTSTSKSKAINDNSILPEEDGFDLKKTSSGTGIVASFKHTFTLSDDKYANSKQQWRNAEATPSVTIIATVDNFSVTTKNLGKLILGSNTEGTVRLNFDTSIRVLADAGGLRYSPANNGNGGALANIANARWTGASAGGSKMIKLGKADIPIGTTGLCITCYFYMYIQMDGTIDIKASMSNSYQLYMKKGWFQKTKVTFTNDSSSPTLDKMEVNANLKAGLQADPGISFWGQTIMDASVKAGFNLTAKVNIYSKDSDEALAEGVYAAVADLEDDSDCSYCINASLSFELTCKLLTKKSVIGKVIIDVFKKSIKDMEKTWPLGSIHYENGAFMSACSRENEHAVEMNSDKEIRLSTYKVSLKEGDEADVSITSVPATESTIELFGGIKVTSSNKDIVKVTYDEETKVAQLTAVGEGSAEITFQITISKTLKKYITQEVSVTVSKDTEKGNTEKQQWYDFLRNHGIYC